MSPDVATLYWRRKDCDAEREPDFRSNCYGLNDSGRLRDEAVSLCVCDNVALAYAFDVGKVEVCQLAAAQVIAHERAHGDVQVCAGATAGSSVLFTACRRPRRYRWSAPWHPCRS